MRIIVTGSGKSGSWKIRGDQLGAAIGADVVPNADKQTINRYDLAVFVKRVPSFSVDIPTVWDMVDCFPQPTSISAVEIAKEIRHTKKRFTASIAATEQMRIDVNADVSIPHHYRPSIQPSQLRAKIKKVGYEGREQYLGEWKEAIESECKKRGYAFVINPENLADCDLLVGFRGRKWRNYMTDSWKSNVKMVNAVAACVPFIAFPECGYMEMDLPFCGVLEPSGISSTLDSLSDISNRMAIADQYRQARQSHSIDAIAARYRAWIASRF